MKKKKILVTGGSGRFAKILKKKNKKLNLIFTSKNNCNILKINSIIKCVKKIKPKIILHCAALSRPMQLHDKDIKKSIDLNIIGTSNITKVCEMFKIKLIYFSTSYVYAGKKGNYSELDPLLPWNNYGWSKLGAESAVQMYKNSLIVRACMTEKPFTHKTAFTNVKSNFIFHDEFARIFLKTIKYKGIINIGGKSQSIYTFAKSNNKNIKGKKCTGQLPLKIYMNLSKLKKLINL